MITGTCNPFGCRLSSSRLAIACHPLALALAAGAAEPSDSQSQNPRTPAAIRQYPREIMMKVFTICALFAAIAIPARAATGPAPSATWKKITAAYTAKARTQGLAADCRPWNKIMGPTCELERAGDFVGVLIPTWTACSLKLKYAAPRSLSQTVELNTCRARWWTGLALPGPWSSG